MSLDFEKRKAIPIPTRIYEDSLIKHFRYLTFIIDHIEKGDKIPAKILKGYFSCFKSKSATNRERKAFIESLVETTYTKFKSFDFEKKHTGSFSFTSPKSLPVTYSFKQMLYIVYDKTIEHLQKNKGIDKTPCIQFIYDIIQSYRKKLTEEHLSDFGDYKIGILCSYVAMQLKFEVSSSVKMNNSKLFQMSRNPIAQMNKKKA